MPWAGKGKCRCYPFSLKAEANPDSSNSDFLFLAVVGEHCKIRHTVVFFNLAKFFVEMQSLAKRYEKASLSWSLGAAGTIRVKWCPCEVMSAKQDLHADAQATEQCILFDLSLQLDNILCSLNEWNIFLLSFTCVSFSLMNDWFWGLCHTPELFVWLL